MIYVLGGSGYIAQAYGRLLTARGVAHRLVSRADLDYTRADLLTAAIKAERVTFLINAAGYTGKPNVDACEADKAACLFGNAVLPGIIAEACARAGIAWGHVSSGCIYTGVRADGSGFSEEDVPNFTFRQNNSSFYSGSKALGEEVLAGRPEIYVWRLRIPFSHRDEPRNYLTKLMRYERLLDAANSITQLDEFAAATVACRERGVPFGVYNVTNPGAITTREVVALIEESGVCRKSFRFFENEAEFMALAAKTPRSNCVLDGAKLERAGIRLTPIRQAIRDALARWEPATREGGPLSISK